MADIVFGSGGRLRPSGFSFGGQKSVPYRNPHPDPTADVPETGDLEVDSRAELTAVGKAFVERRNAEDKRYQHAVDGSYYAVLCFHSRQDLQEFLDAVGMGDRLIRDRYLDGYEFAAKVARAPN